MPGQISHRACVQKTFGLQVHICFLYCPPPSSSCVALSCDWGMGRQGQAMWSAEPGLQAEEAVQKAGVGRFSSQLPDVQPHSTAHPTCLSVFTKANTRMCIPCQCMSLCSGGNHLLSPNEFIFFILPGVSLM